MYRIAGMRLPLLALVLLLVACGASTTEPPLCVPSPEGEGCNDMSSDAVTDSLLTWPDSLDPATGLPWDT